MTSRRRRDDQSRSGLAGKIALLCLLVFGTRGTQLQAQPFVAAEGEPETVRFREARRMAQAVKVTEVTSETRDQVEFLVDPIVRYNDPRRQIHDAGLWVWGHRGRPVAAMKVEDYPGRPSAVRWLNGLVSLSPGLIAAEWDDGRRWTSREPGLDLREIPDSPAPAVASRERFAQIIQLSRRFSAREDAGTYGPMVLQLTPKPVHRYSDPRCGLHDGAIFGFTHETNPDVLLIIELRS